MNNNEQLSINIRTDSGVYGTFRRISYRPWSAIAEFIDNSTQNYFNHKQEIAETTGVGPALEIGVFYDSGAKTLTVVDNANGMGWSELERAIQLNKPPADTTGRSEFGMGLKMAACWFGSRWRVVTKRIGETSEYTALIDVRSLEVDKPDAVVVQQRMGREPLEHYTRIEIEGLYRTFRGRTIPNIRENIASMYRRDIASGDITIRWNGEPFEWERDPVFEETDPNGKTVRWEKDVRFSVDGYDASGRVWIRMPGQASRAGMHLFRRNRLVVGGPGRGYKPREIFAAPNSFQSQRLVGELDLDNWPVSQTKDAFDWDGDLENGFIDKLRSEVVEYVEKTRHIISRADPSEKTTSSDGQVVGDRIKESLRGSSVDSALTIVETGPPPPRELSEEDLRRVERAAENSGTQPTYVRMGSEGVPTLEVFWLDNLPPSDMHATFDMPANDKLRLYVNLNHPFVERVIRRDPAKLELYSLDLFADALVESGIRKRGENVPAHTFRDFKNAILRVINSD